MMVSTSSVTNEQNKMQSDHKYTQLSLSATVSQPFFRTSGPKCNFFEKKKLITIHNHGNLTEL